MEYTFRVRVNRSPTDTIECQESEIHLPTGGLCRSLRLQNKKSDESIKSATHLELTGDGFVTESEAAVSGRRIEVAFMVALARVRVGADFGLRAPKSLVTNEGLKLLERQHGQRVLNDDHGLMVYSSEPKPRFVIVSAQMLRGANLTVFQTHLEQALKVAPDLTDKEVLAFTLFNASFFQPTADTRFLLLVMAIEALIELAPRDMASQAHVHALVTATKTASIPDADRRSMLGSLQWLKKESINQAGKRLTARRLGSRLYANMPAPEYFSHVYLMRSNLVHGNLPYPTFDDVATIVGPLEVFVSDLLTVPILGVPTEA